jgi:hypothetical protein
VHVYAISTAWRPGTMPHVCVSKLSLRHIMRTPCHAAVFTDVPHSTTLHLDYTGPLPDACTSGTRYFQVSCWGGYINIVPLTPLRGTHTAPALKQAVEFFRDKGIKLDTLRMDNQHSPPLAQMVKTLELTLGLVPPHVHNPNYCSKGRVPSGLPAHIS